MLNETTISIWSGLPGTSNHLSFVFPLVALSFMRFGEPRLTLDEIALAAHTSYSSSQWHFFLMHFQRHNLITQ